MSDSTGRRIAYQGEPGSNSHIVCNRHYPDWEPVPCASFEDVFAAVEGGDAQLAMIPIDNSITGRVADIHHFLPDSGLHIIGEHFLRIQFALMALPGATVVEANPAEHDAVRQALAQLGRSMDVRANPQLATGVRLVSPDGKTSIQNTLLGRLERVRGDLAPQISRLVAE